MPGASIDAMDAPALHLYYQDASLFRLKLARFRFSFLNLGSPESDSEGRKGQNSNFRIVMETVSHFQIPISKWHLMRQELGWNGLLSNVGFVDVAAVVVDEEAVVNSDVVV